MTSGARKPVRVLVVDNEVLICRLLCTDLASEPDFIVLEPCFSGEDAVATVLAEPPEIVLMDLQMPGMDGFETTIALRERERAAGRRHTPVVALTASAQTETRDRALSALMDDYVTKPMTMKRLGEVIERWARPVAKV